MGSIHILRLTYTNLCTLRTVKLYAILAMRQIFCYNSPITHAFDYFLVEINPKSRGEKELI